MSSLADAVRSRILLALEGRELTVSELCSILQLPQSTVSRHLRTLSDAGWIDSRPDGTRRLYHLTPDDLEPTARELWNLTRDQVGATPAAHHDALRLESVLSVRRRRSREFFASSSDRWDQVRDQLFGQGFYAAALLGLLEERSTVADLGCGTGAVSEALAPFVRRVVAVDESDAMLDAARLRLASFDNVDLRSGQLEQVPIEDHSVDAATLMLVLHHVPEPARVLGEVARILKPDGRLLVVDMLPHQRAELQQEMGHVWMGFDESRLKRFLAMAELTLTRFTGLPPAPEAKGPTLFVASARPA
jgi:ArsR family transcriptional regulator